MRQCLEAVEEARLRGVAEERMRLRAIIGKVQVYTYSRRKNS